MIGISTLCMLDHNLESVLDTVIPSFEHVEIICEGNHTDLEILHSYSCSISFHAPFSDLNTASLNQDILQESLRQISECIRQAHVYGVNYVCIHPGHYSPLAMHFPEKAQKIQLQSLETLVAVAEERGVILGLENMPHVPILMGTTPEDCSFFLDSIDSENLKMTFDIGHANTTGDVWQFLSLEERMSVIHLHDNLGGTDSHLAMGEGSTDFSMLTNLTAKQLIIEVHSYDSALRSLSYFNTLLSTNIQHR